MEIRAKRRPAAAMAACIGLFAAGIGTDAIGLWADDAAPQATARHANDAHGPASHGKKRRGKKRARPASEKYEQSKYLSPATDTGGPYRFNADGRPIVSEPQPAKKKAKKRKKHRPKKQPKAPAPQVPSQPEQPPAQTQTNSNPMVIPP